MAGSGTGTYGYSSSGYGAQALSGTGTALYASTGGAGTGAIINASTGYGLIARSAGNATVYARNTNGNAGDFGGSYIGLIGRAPSGGFPLIGTDPSGNNLFYVDGAGNVSYKGGLFHFAAIGRGLSVKSYGADTTEPTVEDTGTARLASGVATVRLDRTFAASIAAGNGYRVFVTPNGDTRGLFVATKSSDGFTVREAQGGRSSVAFDYRIVATALGRSGERMALTSDAAGLGTTPRAAEPVLPANAPARIQSARALPAP